ncbi:type V toxin-antitoxin system endoribonuclease antitoxin GhoS [Enterobacteriaceae bacterium H11S18]|uniref:type V toxin-antitoxin system endoribonuclease antitoxin GhoS n=1 Tax=Enterobacteriaceae TaxID=543 RepID=UPI0019279192|nr:MULTISPECIES: type V toxin-antitoxin system endoribonuclease antitoxin GhoS [Enterobacteriaceae]MCT4706281.1 type V toxin-antitoxin system endoribonuclease antitoxin GhoS [Dryocola clanedunensis]MCT4713030.1 type V toxin-antitoxin system endoribonuclease antitoxin GhoS [Dryocola clanedunensis]
MSNGDIVRYVVTVKYKEESLTDINELNNHLTRGGFLLTMSDDDGKIHELGTNTYGLVSALSVQEVEELTKGLGHVALGVEPEVTVTTWEEWKKRREA